MFYPKFNLFCQRVQLCGCFMKFSTTVVGNGKQGAKLNKIMNKFLGSSKSHRKKYYDAIPSGGTPEFLNYVASRPSAKISHRVNVLNKVFMKNITDIMSTGEICSEIINKGIQISKVKMAPTFHVVSVLWVASGSDDDKEIEELLAKLAPKLRHEIAQLQIIGVVPRIEFVKDTSHFRYMQVESILETADYGEGYQRTSLGHDWKSEYNKTELKEEPTDNKTEDTANNETASENSDEELPVMRMDVYGLQYEKIMAKVLISVEKSKALHRRDPLKHPLTPSVNVVNNESSHVISGAERKQLITEYFRKRMRDRKLAIKENRRNLPENLLREQDFENRYANEFLKHFADDLVNDDEFDRSDEYVDCETSEIKDKL